MRCNEFDVFEDELLEVLMGALRYNDEYSNTEDMIRMATAATTTYLLSNPAAIFSSLI